MAKALTQISVEHTRAKDGKRTEIPDGGCRGLYLVVQPTGSKSWALRYRRKDAGKPEKLTLGPVLAGVEPKVDPAIGEPHTLAQARAHAAVLARRVAQGDDPAAELRAARAAKATPAPPDHDQFETVARDFIERYAKVRTRETSWRETARLLGFEPDPSKPGEMRLRSPRKAGAFGGVAHYWRGRNIKSIRRRDVLDLLDAVVDGGTPLQANRCLAAVRRLFNWCVERDRLEVSPCAAVKAPAQETSRDRVLSDEELLEVWQAAGDLGWPFGDLTRLLILTGQRRDEVAEMCWSEVDLKQAMWHLPRERVKNDTAHDLPLSTQALAILDGLKRFTGRPDYVFTTGLTRKGEGSDDEPLLTPISGFSRAKRALDKAILDRARARAIAAGEDAATVQPMKPWRFHDLRRTVASGMAAIGVALPVIEKVLNHKSGSFAGIVGVYQRHEYGPEKRAALQSWADHVDGLGRPAPAAAPPAETNVVVMRRA